ncbi:MAG: hypothetical protein WCC94_07105 [Candidatus Bathyarchaeia archaeon]
MSGSPSPPSVFFHVRARWRLRVKDDYRVLPARKVTGFTFVDPQNAFVDVERRAEYVHRWRLATPAIHGYARKRFIADIIRPLGVDWRVHRQPVKATRVEVFELSHSNSCVLIVLRNWVNPVFAIEITRVSKALNSLALELQQKYDQISKYIIAPALDGWQTTLDQFSTVQFYSLEYIIPESLPDRLARKTGVDYRAAFPHRNQWDGYLVERLQGILRDLLALDPNHGNPETVETRARTRHRASSGNNSTNTMERRPGKAEGSHIVTIKDGELP